jgi:carnitine 3-dehydrogenase
MPIAPCYCNNEVANSNEVARNNEVAMREVKTLGLLGTGVIGGGWAARALHFGIDVVAADVKPEMEAWIRGAIENAEPALARLTLAPLPRKGTLSFTTDLRVMAQRADFIQENIPEQLELKQRK